MLLSLVIVIIVAVVAYKNASKSIESRKIMPRCRDFIHNSCTMVFDFSNFRYFELPWIWELEQKLHLTTGASCDLPRKDDWFELAEALTALNHHLYPSREIYINHIKTNPLATQVKLNDLANNMDLSRIAHPTEEDMERTLRYK